jgi:hypothetical protein
MWTTPMKFTPARNSAGAEMIFDIQDKSYAGGLTCCDPEGYIWHGGAYNPRAPNN